MILMYAKRHRKTQETNDKLNRKFEYIKLNCNWRGIYLFILLSFAFHTHTHTHWKFSNLILEIFNMKMEKIIVKLC